MGKVFATTKDVAKSCRNATKKVVAINYFLVTQLWLMKIFSNNNYCCDKILFFRNNITCGKKIGGRVVNNML